MLKNAELVRNLAYVDGRWLGANDGSTFDVSDPSTGSRISSVPDMGAAETDQAIDAAARAFKTWAATTAKERSAVLRRWFALINERADDLAQLITAEQGKPLTEAKAEIAYAASFVEWFAEEGKRVYGDVIPTPQNDKRLVVLKQPIGVVACITPWNFPAAMVTRKAAPALAAGCTVVLKPAEQTPLTALALTHLAAQAGVPPGVLNVVTGDPVAIGRALTRSKTVRKVSFTGSTEVGRLLMEQCAPTIKKLSLELGGNAPFIVFSDADVEAAVEGALISKYRNTGQTCVCTNRFLIHDHVYERFARLFSEKVAALKVADGREAGAMQGPLIDQAALAKVQAHVADALAKGGRILTGGKPHQRGGTYFSPTVIGDVKPHMVCVQEETFGPVAALMRFSSDEEVVALANDTPYGLAAYFYSRDIGRVWRVAEALEYGIVGVNTGLFSNEVAPFGGFKESGIGREGSKYGIDGFLEVKYVAFGGL